MNPDLIKYIYEDDSQVFSYKKIVTAVLWNDYHVTVEIPQEWIDKDFAIGDKGLSIGKAVYDAVKDVVLNQLTDELYKKIKVSPELPKKVPLPLPHWETVVNAQNLIKKTEGELLSPEQLEQKILNKGYENLTQDMFAVEGLDKKAADMFAEAYKESQLDDSTIVKSHSDHVHLSFKKIKQPTLQYQAEALTNMVQKGAISPKEMMDYINTFKNLDAKKSPSYKPPGSNPPKLQAPSDHFKPKTSKPFIKPKPSGLSSNVVNKLAKFIPALNEFRVDDCPACRETYNEHGQNAFAFAWPSGHPQKGMPLGSTYAPRMLSDMIILLNDTHDWEREGKTSEWLESLPCDITFREPGPKGPLADLPPVPNPGQFPSF